MNNQYKDDSIQTLDPIEHVKLRPGMYVGDTSTPNQLLLEIFSNSLDEYNIGHGEKIYVTINKNGVCKCIDEAQGFPINVIREDNKTVLEASFSVINSSGKFTEDGVYGGNSLGLNGLGGKITNFLSEWFEVISWNNKQYEKLFFEEGILKSRETGVWKDINRPPSGTEISYKPSKKYFDTDITNIKYFEDFFNDITCLCPGLTVYLNEKLIQHDSIEELIDIKNNNNIELISNRLVIEHKEKAGQFDLALSYNDTAGSHIISYVNYGLTTIGPHLTSIKSTITRVLNKWAKEQGLLKAKDKNLDGNSLQEGLLLVCNLVTTNVAYNAQVKTTVTKIDSSFATNKLAEALEIWLDNHISDGKTIIEKALVARKAAEAAKKAREQVRAKSTVKVKNKIEVLPSKLSDANSKDRSKCEVFLMEGDSAAGGAKTIRDAKTQAIMPLRGKILNVLTAQSKSIIANQEIQNMVDAFGCEWSADKKSVIYNKENIRYDKIIIASDADFDGFHIQSLLLTFFWTMIPDLLLDGFVYLAIPPRYKVEWGKDNYKYLADDKELEKFKENHSNYSLSYFKGIGEMDSKELGAAIMNPETRQIEQVVIEDIEEFDKWINNLMGKDSKPKHNFIFGETND